MNRMLSGGVKGVGAILTMWIAYIDKTFTPLFWALLILAFVDILLNVHKEGQQFAKIGSMAVSIGVPSWLASNIGIPDAGKYLVGMMVIVYLQLVVPQVIDRMSKLTFSHDPKTQAVDSQLVDAVVQQVAAQLEQKAQAVEASAKEAGTGPVIQGVNGDNNRGA